MYTLHTHTHTHTHARTHAHAQTRAQTLQIQMYARKLTTRGFEDKWKGGEGHVAVAAKREATRDHVGLPQVGV